MPSFGEELRRERELREISLREVSQATKISMRYLEAMERNDFDYLPGGLFNRGFVRAYCQHIGIDSESMVNAYLLEEQSREAGASAPGMLRGRSSSAAAPAMAPQARRGRSRWVRVALVILLLIAASVWGWWYLAGRPEAGEPGRDGAIVRPAVAADAEPA